MQNKEIKRNPLPNLSTISIKQQTSHSKHTTLQDLTNFTVKPTHLYMYSYNDQTNNKDKDKDKDKGEADNRFMSSMSDMSHDEGCCQNYFEESVHTENHVNSTSIYPIPLTITPPTPSSKFITVNVNSRSAQNSTSNPHSPPLTLTPTSPCKSCLIYEHYLQQSQTALLQIQNKMIHRQRQLQQKFKQMQNQVKTTRRALEEREVMYRELKETSVKEIKELSEALQRLKSGSGGNSERIANINRQNFQTNFKSIKNPHNNSIDRYNNIDSIISEHSYYIDSCDNPINTNTQNSHLPMKRKLIYSQKQQNIQQYQKQQDPTIIQAPKTPDIIDKTTKKQMIINQSTHDPTHYNHNKININNHNEVSAPPTTNTQQLLSQKTIKTIKLNNNNNPIHVQESMSINNHNNNPNPNSNNDDNNNNNNNNNSYYYTNTKNRMKTQQVTATIINNNRGSKISDTNKYPNDELTTVISYPIDIDKCTNNFGNNINVNKNKNACNMNPNGKNTHINTNTNMKNTAKKYTNYNDNDNDNDNNDCNLSIAEPAKRNTKLIFDNIELDVRQVKQILENMKKLEFQNQNLKSYNRVLLQKLSNSRPKKY